MVSVFAYLKQEAKLQLIPGSRLSNAADELGFAPILGNPAVELKIVPGVYRVGKKRY